MRGYKNLESIILWVILLNMPLLVHKKTPLIIIIIAITAITPIRRGLCTIVLFLRIYFSLCSSQSKKLTKLTPVTISNTLYRPRYLESTAFDGDWTHTMVIIVNASMPVKIRTAPKTSPSVWKTFNVLNFCSMAFSPSN